MKKIISETKFYVLSVAGIILLLAACYYLGLFLYDHFSDEYLTSNGEDWSSIADKMNAIIGVPLAVFGSATAIFLALLGLRISQQSLRLEKRIALNDAIERLEIKISEDIDTIAMLVQDTDEAIKAFLSYHELSDSEHPHWAKLNELLYYAGVDSIEEILTEQQESFENFIVPELTTEKKRCLDFQRKIDDERFRSSIHAKQVAENYLRNTIHTLLTHCGTDKFEASLKSRFGKSLDNLRYIADLSDEAIMGNGHLNFMEFLEKEHRKEFYHREISITQALLLSGEYFNMNTKDINSHEIAFYIKNADLGIGKMLYLGFFKNLEALLDCLNPYLPYISSYKNQTNTRMDILPGFIIAAFESYNPYDTIEIFRKELDDIYHPNAIPDEASLLFNARIESILHKKIPFSSRIFQN